ncbi:MAG: hypothetical protein ABEJ55_03610 [Halanaeroarchaeum sp.]
MLLVVTYSSAARGSLRNVVRGHPETVVRRFGRAVLLVETELAALLALRLREKHPGDVQVETTTPLNEFARVPESVRAAAEAYENRERPSTTYANFVAGTAHPRIEDLRGVDL